ncbi:hypothetical protein ACHAWO_003524 [Cyclotella atomus]|jgi:serine/arginine repetitive matrix protein 1|uniref:PWI domain-containing protein n=1 Tax=Cyclotella atomus TaxID=382360 RepID=A0ABD3MYX9_9STRA
MPAIKGTASISSTHALSKQLRTTTFPSHFSTKVNISKLHRGVLSHFIEQRITEILGFEDEIVSDTAINLFLPEDYGSDANKGDVDPRKAQLDLVGFLGEKESAEFASELWEMMIDGSQRQSGIPLILVEKKKEEMKRAREAGHSVAVAPKRGIAGGPQGAEMKSMVMEAARRAEMARAALGNPGREVSDRVQNVPPSPIGRDGELFIIDRTGRDVDRGHDDRYRDDRRHEGYRDDRRYEDRGQSRGGLDEFGRQRGESSGDRKSETQRRRRSPSPSRSRSRSSSVSSGERRHRRRDDSRRSKRSRSRSDSSEDVRRRRRDGKDRR